MISEIQNLILNKQIIIEKAIKRIKSKYPTRTHQYDKCYRDLNYVFDSFVNDLSENTTRHTINIGSKFYSNGVLLLRNKKVEIEVYDYIMNDIEKRNIINNHTLEKIISLKNILVHILECGPIHKMDFLEATVSAQHCQRNWDLSKTVDHDIINWLLDIGLSTPTKQNLYTFDIVCVTDREKINRLSKIAVNGDTNNSHLSDEIKNKIRVQNPQTDANVLFMFFIKPESRTSELRKIREKGDEELETVWNQNVNLEIGISAGAIAIAANSIGMKSGFCRCIDRSAFPKDISNEIDIDGDCLQLMLGIGYPITKLPHFIQSNKVHDETSFAKPSLRRIVI